MSRLTFTKDQHLATRQEFSDCYEKGQRFFSKHFVVIVRNRDLQSVKWRLGLAVGRKIGSAVKRNRVKRVLREFFRLNQYDIPNGFDYVVIPKKHLHAKLINLKMVETELFSLLNSKLLIKLSTE
ncbi:ribonuclease P protein component [Desulfovibrio litoralis]|uniref:ribonuclease P protein component n=1 Tax=Desulfovibrio litoralis TaxID=466107 RepID=UPI00093358C9|nr:ribonuclease P protein component [Desulfovibrio litoralis]